MSGHSKWATTKHRKGAQDAKRSALFSKLSRNITVAARLGGDPLPENNASLAAAVALPICRRYTGDPSGRDGSGCGSASAKVRQRSAHSARCFLQNSWKLVSFSFLL